MEKRETIAFSAYRSKSQTLSPGEKVIIDRVQTNVGNGYEPSTGVFKATHPGLHHFTAVLMSSENKDLSLYLNLNGLRMTRSYIYGDGYKRGTFDAVCNLQKGDKVHMDSDKNETIYSAGSKFLTFSGYRITQTKNGSLDISYFLQLLKSIEHILNTYTNLFVLTLLGGN